MVRPDGVSYALSSLYLIRLLAHVIEGRSMPSPVLLLRTCVCICMEPSDQCAVGGC